MKNISRGKSPKIKHRPPAAADPAVKSILVPTDFSECSEQALKFALALAGPLGATLTLLHVVDEVLQPDLGMYPIAVDYGEVKRVMRGRLERWALRLCGKQAGVKTRVELGKPFHWITAVAQDLKSDLIVIGSHGITNWKEALIGTTAERVARHATGPVLLVRGQKIKTTRKK